MIISIKNSFEFEEFIHPSTLDEPYEQLIKALTHTQKHE